MTYRKVVQSYYDDISNLTDLLGKLVSSYRLLVGGADELNKIALASKGDIKDALRRAEKVGEIIDDLIRSLDSVSPDYISYCELKSKIIKCKLEEQNILTEIDEELKLKD